MINSQSFDPLLIYHDFIYQFKQLYFNPEVGLLIVDHGKIVNVNHQMAIQLGFNSAIDLLGKDFSTVKLPEKEIVQINIGGPESKRLLYFSPSEKYPKEETLGMALRLDHMLSSKQKPILLAEHEALKAGRLAYINPAAKALLSIDSLKDYTLSEWVHPVDLQKFQTFVEESIDHPSSRKVFHLHPVNRPQLKIYFQCYPLVLWDKHYLLFTLEDPLIQETLDAKNRESQSSIQSYYCNTKDPMAILDEKMQIREVNMAFSHLLGFPDDSILGKDFNDLLRDSIVTDKLNHLDQSVVVTLEDYYNQIHKMKVYELPIFLEDAHIGKYVSLLPYQFKTPVEYKKLIQEHYQIIPPQLLLIDKDHLVLWSSSSNGISGEFSTGSIAKQQIEHFVTKQSKPIFDKAMETLQNGADSWFGQLWLESPGEKQRLRHAFISPLIGQDGAIFGYTLILYPIQREREMSQLINTLCYMDLTTKRKNAASLSPVLSDWIYEASALDKRFSLIQFQICPLTPEVSTVEEELAMETLLALLDDHLGSEGDLIRNMNTGFILLHKGLRLKKDAIRFIQAILKDLTTRLELENLQDSFTCVTGVSCFPADSNETDGLIDNLKASLEENRLLRGHLKLSEQKTLALRHKEGMIIQYLREGLPKGEFYIVYQPLIDLQTKKVTGMETLLRWKNEEVGTVSPNEFIPLAEKSNLIVKIGYFVIGETIRKLHQLREKGHVLTSSVNISIKQLEMPDFAEKITNMMLDYELPGSSLEFEITESITTSLHPAVSANISALTQFGIFFNIDDFGTGYSSLKQIQDLKIKSLKIDRSLIEDMVENPGNQSLVRAISAMAKSSGLKLIAEGVETQDQLAALEQIGIEEAQGFLFSMPLGELDIERFIEDHRTIHG